MAESGDPTRIGVIGLGVMGGAIAKNLILGGFSVSAYDRDRKKTRAAADHGAHACQSAEQVAARSDMMILSLPSSDALRETVDAIGGSARPGLIVAECSTLDLACKFDARDALADLGMIMLDCPLSGTGSQAVSRQLVVLASGDRAAFDRARGVFQAISQRQTHIGAFGNGTRLKFVANILIANHIAAAAEALCLAELAGLPADQVHEFLSDSPASSAMFALRGALMAKRTYHPAQMSMTLWQKDLHLIDSFAEDLGATTALFDQAKTMFQRAQSLMPDADTAGIFEIYRSDCGVEPPESA